MIYKSTRRLIAHRAVTRLASRGQISNAINIFKYVSANHEDFGIKPLNPGNIADLRKSDTFESIEIFANNYFGEINALDSAYDEQRSSREHESTTHYLARLICHDRLLYAFFDIVHMAATDKSVREILCLAAFGPGAHLNSSNAVPIAGLAIVSHHSMSFSLHTTFKICEDTLFEINYAKRTQIVKENNESGNISNFICENITFPTTDDIDEFTSISLHTHIFEAISGNRAISSHVTRNISYSANSIDSINKFTALSLSAARKNIPGINTAIRSENYDIILDLISSSASDDVKINSISEDHPWLLLIGILAYQAAVHLKKSSWISSKNILVVNEQNSIITQYKEIVMAETISGGPIEPFDTYDDSNNQVIKNIIKISSQYYIAPVIWVIDTKSPMSPPLVEIFSDIREIEVDNNFIKTRTILDMCAAYGVEISEHHASKIASYCENPRDFDSLIRARSFESCHDPIDEACLKFLTKAKHTNVPRVHTPTGYDIRFVNCADPIEKIVNLLKPIKDRKIPILFHGLPGTSKTSLARYIAEQIGLKATTVRISDIAGKYVGETEKAIKSAFEKAADTNSFLIFDEVDSMLQNRSDAKNSWERNQVNEMLTCMDAHNLPFACTTNHIKHIDPAALRRFTFKYELLPLTAEQSQLAWVEILRLNIEDYPSKFDYSNITIADFVQISEQMSILMEHNPKYAINSLEKEIELRDGVGPKSFGFLSN